MSDTQNRTQNDEMLDRAYAALGKLLDKILVLRVTTVVGTVTADAVSDPMTPTTINVAPAGQLVGYSAIDMVRGDMDVVLSKEFVGDAALMAMHTQALLESREIRSNSIELLRTAITALSGKAF